MAARSDEGRVAPLLGRAADGLRGVDGVVAVVLGGSWARGTARPDSDIDLGLYYRESRPPDIDTVRAVARELNDRPDPVVTGLYEWGRWVNGGAWLTVGGQRLDLLYRNLDQVERVVADCEAGETQTDFWQQASYGFYSPIYLAELHACRPLHDPTGVIGTLKERVAVYPLALRTSLVRGWLWTADFGHDQATKLAARGDVYGTVGCLTRTAAALTQVLFALNETYFAGDKDALARIDGFRLRPDDYRSRLERLLACPGADPAALGATVHALHDLTGEVVALAGPLYARRY